GQQPLDDAAGLPHAAGLAEIGHRRGSRQMAMGAQAHQIRVTGAKADADDLPPAHSAGPANALMAATVMAEPPGLPLTIHQGTGLSAASAALDSAAPMKPTGQPIIAAGRGQAGSSSMFSR